MDIEAYVILIASKVKEAADRGDREESVRLLRLLRDVAEEKANEIERGVKDPGR